MIKPRSKKKPAKKQPLPDLIWDHKLVEEMGELLIEIGGMHGTKGNRPLLRDELADVQAALVIFRRMNFPKKRDRKAFARRVAMKVKRGLKKLEQANGSGKNLGRSRTLPAGGRNKARKPVQKRKRQDKVLPPGDKAG